MAEPFLGELRMMAFNFAPRGWALCDGQLLPINQNQALFALLGTIYGGDGRTNFALPELRGRSPLHRSNDLAQGARGGETQHSLTVAELPSHSHTLSGSSDVANSNLPGAALPAGKPRGGINRYAAAGSGDVTLHTGSLSSAPGGGQPHENMQPYTAISFAIALQGIFPSRS